MNERLSKKVCIKYYNDIKKIIAQVLLMATTFNVGLLTKKGTTSE